MWRSLHNTRVLLVEPHRFVRIVHSVHVPTLPQVLTFLGQPVWEARLSGGWFALCGWTLRTRWVSWVVRMRVVALAQDRSRSTYNTLNTVTLRFCGPWKTNSHTQTKCANMKREGNYRRLPFIWRCPPLSSWVDMSAQQPLSESFSVLAGLCISKLTCKTTNVHYDRASGLCCHLVPRWDQLNWVFLLLPPVLWVHSSAKHQTPLNTVILTTQIRGQRSLAACELQMTLSQSIVPFCKD